jgi:hypothetical protein
MALHIVGLKVEAELGTVQRRFMSALVGVQTSGYFSIRTQTSLADSEPTETGRRGEAKVGARATIDGVEVNEKVTAHFLKVGWQQDADLSTRCFPSAAVRIGRGRYRTTAFRKISSDQAEGSAGQKPMGNNEAFSYNS